MIEAATKAHNIPYIRTSGSSEYSFDLRTSLRIVLVTCAPSNIDPPNSHTAAMTTANRKETDLAATEVAKALAQSLAPIPKAYQKPNIGAATVIQ